MSKPTSLDRLFNLYQELATCPSCPELIDHLVQRIQEQFEEFKSDVDQFAQKDILRLIEVHAQAKSKLLAQLAQLDRELSCCKQASLAETEYLKISSLLYFCYFRKLNNHLGK